VSVVTIKVFFIIFVKELEGNVVNTKKWLDPTLTNYENIAVTLCLMSIAILKRRLRDRARVRRRPTRSWLLRRKQRSAYNTLLKELHIEDPNEFQNYFRMDKTTIQSILL
jgi:ribose 1,5-bisphosphokinase PhnN